MLVEIWSDVVCPWCAIGKARFDRARAAFDQRDDVEVRWRSFQLDPSADNDDDIPTIERLAIKYRVPVDEARDMVERVQTTAAADGLTLDLVHARAANTLDAHRLLHLAANRDLADAAQEAFMRAALAERAHVGNHATLRRLATGVGLDEVEVDDVLASDRYLDRVRSDQQEAYELGCSGVPFFVFDRRLAAAGAQPVDTFLQALHRVAGTPA